MAEMQSRPFESLEGLHLDETLESLVQVHSKDPELFFLLATERVDPSAMRDVSGLSMLAHTVCDIVIHGYEISLTPTQAELRGGGRTIRFNRESADQVRLFLRAINGVRRGELGGKDYRGRVASKAEIAFLLGDRESWGADEDKLRKLMAESPTILRLADEERHDLEEGTPAYCLHALEKCATRVVLAPSAVFLGLRSEGALADGVAYCGNPKYAYGNDGTRIGADLDGFVFVVYADAERYVFDWDWVEADPDDPSIPRYSSERFSYRTESTNSVLVGVEGLKAGEFVPRAWHSRRGDCIFYYISDAPSYASRVNDELTVFLSFGPARKMTGCKVKHVDRIWKDVRDSQRLREEPKASVPLVSILANSYAVQALNGHASHYAELINCADSTNAEIELNVDS
ncbi:MAG: hypothetical protein ACKV22_19765 [Bryobacteraceae bacterium]